MFLINVYRQPKGNMMFLNMFGLVSPVFIGKILRMCRNDLSGILASSFNNIYMEGNIIKTWNNKFDCLRTLFV